MAVGAFAEHLRKSPHAAGIWLEEVAHIAAASAYGRKERLELVTPKNMADYASRN